MDLALLSDVLFGRSMRLPIAIFVLEKESGLVYPLEIAEELGHKPTYVAQELGRLASIGMVTELPKGDSRRRYFQRLDHPYWRIIKIAKGAASDAPQERTKYST